MHGLRRAPGTALLSVAIVVSALTPAVADGHRALVLVRGSRRSARSAWRSGEEQRSAMLLGLIVTDVVHPSLMLHRDRFTCRFGVAIRGVRTRPTQPVKGEMMTVTDPNPIYTELLAEHPLTNLPPGSPEGRDSVDGEAAGQSNEGPEG